MWGESDTDIDKPESFPSMSQYSEFPIIPRALSVALLWGWNNGCVCLAAYETCFPSGCLPDVIHPYSVCSCCHLVAVVSPGKMERGKLWVLTLAGTRGKTTSRLFQLVYFQGALGRDFWGCSVHTISLLPERVFFTESSPLIITIVPSHYCDCMSGLNKPTAGHCFQEFTFQWLTHWTERNEMYK